MSYSNKGKALPHNRKLKYGGKGRRAILDTIQTPHKKGLACPRQNRNPTAHPLIIAHQKAIPRVNEAIAIAAALNTTVEFLVSGKDTCNTTASPAAMSIALTMAPASKAKM